VFRGAGWCTIIQGLACHQIQKVESMVMNYFEILMP
jgi:hypothetical protein